MSFLLGILGILAIIVGLFIAVFIDDLPRHIRGSVIFILKLTAVVVIVWAIFDYDSRHPSSASSSGYESDYQPWPYAN